MREIKFRGLRIDNKEWVYGTPVYACGRVYITINAFDKEPPCPYWAIPVGESWEVIPETVGQFTGLKDMNGKEIYEGDILKADYKGYDSIEVVLWNNPHSEYSRYENINRQRQLSFDGAQAEVSEIIGNIHQNPELLQKDGD